MLRICEDTHVYRAVLRGKSNKHIFEEETQKKKILDVVVNVREIMGFQILAYCVLDNELHLLLKGEEETGINNGLKKMQQQYEEVYFRMYGKNIGGKLWKKSFLQEIPVEWKAIYHCVRMHTFPVAQRLVSRPEDYWWCSYNDYLGRDWMHLTRPDIVLSWLDGNSGKAVKLFKQQHRQRIFRINHFPDLKKEAI